VSPTPDPLAAVPRLQTAAALENTAVLTYTALLGLDVVTGGDASVRAVLATTLTHHAAHAAAFQAAAVAAGGAPQELPETELLTAVRGRLTAVTTLGDALGVAALVESRLTATYVTDATAAGTAALRTLYVGTAGVEAQHTTFLRIAAAAAGTDLPLTTRLQLRGAGALPAVATGAPTAFATTAGATDATAGAVG
jgi:hypothetical protein